MMKEAGIPIVCSDFELEEGELNADYVVNDFEVLLIKLWIVLRIEDMRRLDILARMNRDLRFSESRQKISCF